MKDNGPVALCRFSTAGGHHRDAVIGYDPEASTADKSGPGQAVAEAPAAGRFSRLAGRNGPRAHLVRAAERLASLPGNRPGTGLRAGGQTPRRQQLSPNAIDPDGIESARNADSARLTVLKAEMGTTHGSMSYEHPSAQVIRPRWVSPYIAT